MRRIDDMRTFGIPRVAIAALLGLCLIGPAAQAQKPPVDPAAVAAAKEMLTVRGSDVRFAQVLVTTLKSRAEARRKQNPSKAKDIDEIFAALADKLGARAGDYVEWMAQLYAERFTAAELNEVIAFHKSPVGQKMLKTQPEIAEQSTLIAKAWGRKLGEEVDSEFQRESKKRGLDL
jgi:uncharacterized protein